MVAGLQLDPNMIQSLGGPRYSLKVPRTALFNVWVEPIVEVEVSLQQLPGSRGVLIKVIMKPPDTGLNELVMHRIDCVSIVVNTAG